MQTESHDPEIPYRRKGKVTFELLSLVVTEGSLAGSTEADRRVLVALWAKDRLEASGRHNGTQKPCSLSTVS